MNYKLGNMNLNRFSSFGYLRSGLIFIFIVMAVFALYLDFAYAPPQWVILDDTVGRFLGFVIISIGPELAGLAIAITLIDFVNEKHKQAAAIEKLKRELIVKFGSQHNATAELAAKELLNNDWLIDGSMRYEDFEGANLMNLYLVKGDFVGSNFSGAIVKNSNLIEANLAYSKLGNTDFEDAYLHRANLKNSSLYRTNFRGAYLTGANFEGALIHQTDFRGAHLKNAIITPDQLGKAKLDETTVLPNGENFQLG